MTADFKVFVINLDRSKKRLINISNQLEKLGIPFERFPAVDGNGIINQEIYFNKKRFKLECLHDVVPGEVGCSLSHINIWRKIVDSKIPFALVLEDDVDLDKELPRFLSSQEFKKADFLKLDYDSNKYTGSQPKIIQSLGKEVVECDLAPYSAAGYIISKKAASIFLNSTKNMYYPIDLLPWYTNRFCIQAYTRTCYVRHPHEESEIGQRDFLTRNMTLDFTYLCHKVFRRIYIRRLLAFFRSMMSSSK